MTVIIKEPIYECDLCEKQQERPEEDRELGDENFLPKGWLCVKTARPGDSDLYIEVCPACCARTGLAAAMKVKGKPA